MFEGMIGSLLNILSLSIGGVSIVTIIATFIVLCKKIKSVSLTKDYVEKAFEKAVLPANVKLDISNKIIPLVKKSLSDIETQLKSYLQENFDEIQKVKEELQLTLTILSKFSHCQQLTDDEKARLQTLIQCDDEIKEIEV